MLNVVRHAVEVYCDSDHIPEQFTADLGPLDFNDNLRWHDLRGIEGTRAVIDRDFVIATVVPPTKIEEAAAVAGAAPAAAPRRLRRKRPRSEADFSRRVVTGDRSRIMRGEMRVLSFGAALPARSSGGRM